VAGLRDLDPGDVDVWTLDVRAPAARALGELLTPEEAERAASFAREELSRRWAAARGLLRSVLARYAGCAPAEVEIVRRPCLHCGGAHGKPALAREDETGIAFNLSHSHDLAAVAVSAGLEVGLDVERRDGGRDLERLARATLEDAEREIVLGLPAGERERAFFDAWTRKEALLKATAEGIYRPLREVRVPIEPGARFTTALDGPDRRRFTVADVEVGAGYSGAVAVLGEAARPRVRAWEG
jgi:4'-phosphopantetheinyl transferase